MARVTRHDIIKMNNAYFHCGNKAEVARQTGFSASTVSKYLIEGYKPPMETALSGLELNELDYSMFDCFNWNHLIQLSDFEWEEMNNMRESVIV